LQPGPQDCDRLFGQRRAPLLTAFTHNAYVSPCTEVHIFAPKAGDLGEAYTGLYGYQQQCVIAAPRPALLAWNRQQCVDLVTREIADLCPHISFRWDGQHTLDLRRPGRHLERGKVEEGSDGRQSAVATASRDTSVLLQVVEERTDQRSIDVLERDAIRGL